MSDSFGNWCRLTVWPFVQSFTRGTRRRVVLGAVLLLVVAKTVQWFRALTVGQTAKHLPDSDVFLEAAAQPFSFEHVFYPKPPLTSIFYRWFGPDAKTLVAAQEVLSIVAWLTLAVVLMIVVQRTRARIAGLVIVIGFAIAPFRVGFTGTLLSESLNDSLLALLLSAMLLVVRFARATTRWQGAAIAGGVLVLLTCWLWVRDTNAVTCMVAALILAIWLWRRQQWRAAWWAVALAGVGVVMSILVIASTRVVPDQPLPISMMRTWAPETTARGAFSTVNNILIRMMATPDGRAFLLERGMPWGPESEPFVNDAAWGAFLGESKYAATRDWIMEHGASAHLSWLVRHPVRYLGEFGADLWTALGASELTVFVPEEWAGNSYGKTLTPYMPLEWRANTYGRTVMRAYRTLTTSRPLLAVILLACPLLLWRARRHPLAAFIVIAMASAFVGMLASYFGDSIEEARHCWGASQQLLVAAFLAIVIALDGKRTD